MSAVLRAPHAVRSPQVQGAIERWTEAVLRDSGRVSIEFGCKDGQGVSVGERVVELPGATAAAAAAEELSDAGAA